MLNNEDIMLESLNEQLHKSELNEYMEYFSKVPMRLREALTLKQYDTMLEDLHKFETNLNKLDKSIEDRSDYTDFIKDVKALKQRVSELIKKASSKPYKNAVLQANGMQPDITGDDERNIEPKEQNDEL